MDGATILPISEPAGRGRKNLSDEERRMIAKQLISKSIDGELKKGCITTVAIKFYTSRQTVSKIWNIAKVQLAEGGAVDVKSKMKGNVGRKEITLDRELLKNTPLTKRTNFRSMGCAMGVSKSKLHKLAKQKVIRAHSNAIKPLLTQENMRNRIAFCLSQVETIAGQLPTFQTYSNTIHIDEKWFYMTKPATKYYMDPSEPDPLRTCKSKRFIGKVMFLAAVARPLFDADGQTLFDGKIGIFPFVYDEPTKRRSKNKEAGVMETKAVTMVNKEYTRKCLIEKVLPAIKAKWPSEKGRTIYIQQDNARPHLAPTDTEWTTTATADGWDINLSCQSANSPDLNVLDLGFFRAIDSIQHRNCPKTITELLSGVDEAFDSLSPKSLNFVWLSLQQCMIEILKSKGSNGYRLQHMGKERLLREGSLPISLNVDPMLLSDCTDFLSSNV